MPGLTEAEYQILKNGGRSDREVREQLIETQSQVVQCADPHCVDADGRPSIAEPEQDGDHLFYVCLTCGYEFGWDRAPNPTSDPTCQIGVPEEVRRAFSVDPSSAAPAGPAPSTVSLGPTRRKT